MIQQCLYLINSINFPSFNNYNYIIKKLGVEFTSTLSNQGTVLIFIFYIFF